jgi:hypothetical protein
MYVILLSICLPSLFVHLCLCIFDCLPFSLANGPPVCLLVHLYVYVSVHLSAHPFLLDFLPSYLFSVTTSVCLTVCLLRSYQASCNVCGQDTSVAIKVPHSGKLRPCPHTRLERLSRDKTP